MGAAGGVLRPTPLAGGALIVRFGSRDGPQRVGGQSREIGLLEKSSLSGKENMDLYNRVNIVTEGIVALNPTFS
jgi:hypothetical protein